MNKHYLSQLILSSLLIVLPPAALAQTPATAPLLSSPAAELNSVTADSAIDEELSDSDLSVDLAAEALPTQNQFTYRWENMRNGVLRFFTLKAENKAELYERHLHTLDRKLAACAEIGDEECTKLIEAHIEKLTARATNYLERREELRDKLQDKFQAWRQHREAMITERQQRVAELKDKREELVAARQAVTEQARQNRAARQEEIKTNIQERRELIEQNIDQRQENRQEIRQDAQEQRQLNLEQRRENQEQLIEMRRQNVKDKLDNTRAKVEARQEAAATLDAE